MKTRLSALITLCALAATGCAASDPLSNGATPAPRASGTGTVKVGSAGFAESEIVAELYAQALEAKGVTVERRMQIGARDVYLAALKDGSIDLVPEYTGNLLQYYDTSSSAKTEDEVNRALASKVPSGYQVLKPAAAQDKDSYNVTREFAEKHGLKTLGDLAKVAEPMKVGGNPELEKRPYGPQGLTSTYGVPAAKMSFVAISDGGGPMTVKALKNGDVQVADLYTTTPAITENGFVTLEDPKNLILPQNVVPLIADRAATDTVIETLDSVSAKLTTDDLIALNAKNMGAEKLAPKAVASTWLKEKGLAAK